MVITPKKTDNRKKSCLFPWNSPKEVSYLNTLLKLELSQKLWLEVTSNNWSMLWNIVIAKVFVTEILNQKTFYLMISSISNFAISDFLLLSEEEMNLDGCTLCWEPNLIWVLKFMKNKPIREKKWTYLHQQLCYSLCMQAPLLSPRPLKEILTISWYLLTKLILFGKHTPDTNKKDITVTHLKIYWAECSNLIHSKD